MIGQAESKPDKRGCETNAAWQGIAVNTEIRILPNQPK